MSKRAAAVIAVCLFGALVFVFRTFWLTQVGYTVEARPVEGLSPARNEAILIPNADHLVNDTCTAMLGQAASLSAASGGKPIFMTCPLWYGVSVCEVATAAAARDGHSITIRAISTDELPDQDEAELGLQKLQGSGVHSVTILLPTYKTRRLGAWYRKVASRLGMEVRVVPSACQGFDARTWWTERESRKLLAYEIIRRVAGF